MREGERERLREVEKGRKGENFPELSKMVNLNLS